MSIAIINGKLLDEENKVNVRNLLIQGKKVTGVGYIPDEDEDALHFPDDTETQWSHLLHGRMDKSVSIQFNDLAKIRATVVLPVPLGPENRYACAMRSRSKAFNNVLVTCS